MTRQYTLDFVKRNTTGVVLTEENIQPGSEISRQVDLGFIQARCMMCNAQLYLSEDGTVMCLNACNIPHGEVMRALKMMEEIRGQDV